MSNVRIDTGYRPGVIGRVAQLHAEYYATHWDFGAFFEAKVASELSDFVGRYDARRDGLWSVIRDDRIEGSIVVDGLHAQEDRGAHLRWFIVSDAVRGRGCGRRLLAAAIDFCRRQRYRRVFLWTFEGLEPARHLYEQAGFRVVETCRGSQWGREVSEQRYELVLPHDG